MKMGAVGMRSCSCTGGGGGVSGMGPLALTCRGRDAVGEEDEVEELEEVLEVEAPGDGGGGCAIGEHRDLEPIM